MAAEPVAMVPDRPVPTAAGGGQVREAVAVMDTGVREDVGVLVCVGGGVEVSVGVAPSLSELVAEDVCVAVAVVVLDAVLVGVGGV